MKWLLVLICSFPFVVICLVDYVPADTRKEMEIRRRFMSTQNSTTIYQKNTYFKRAISKASSGNPDKLSLVNWGNIAFEMQKIEHEYDLPYYWGGSIRNHYQGLDCSGFIHGILYYTGESDYRRRFTTKSFYQKLRRDSDYKEVFNSSGVVAYDIDNVVTLLDVGDIILWPSFIDDGKNLPGAIWGHVGIVSHFVDGEPYVTHYVSSDAYNNLDSIGETGPGLNSLNATTFISLKKRGILSVYRFEESRFLNI